MATPGTIRLDPADPQNFQVALRDGQFAQVGSVVQVVHPYTQIVQGVTAKWVVKQIVYNSAGNVLLGGGPVTNNFYAPYSSALQCILITL